MNKTEFLEALEENNIKKIIDLIKSSKTLDEYQKSEDYKIYEDEFPLNDVILENDFEVVKLLVDSGANVNVFGGICAVTAIGDKNMEILNYLVEKGIDINNYDELFKNKSFYTPIEMAACTNDLEMVNRLLELGANIFYESPNSSAMAYAIFNNNKDIILRLLQAGMEINRYEKYHKESKTPLFAAIDLEDIEFLDKLIELGADINYEEEGLPTALMYALKSEFYKSYKTEEQDKDFKISKHLVNLGAKINDYSIIKKSSEKSLKKILENGLFDTVLLTSLFHIDKNLMIFLIEKGINLNEFVEINGQKIYTFEYFIYDICKHRCPNSPNHYSLNFIKFLVENGAFVRSEFIEIINEEYGNENEDIYEILKSTIR